MNRWMQQMHMRLHGQLHYRKRIAIIATMMDQSRCHGEGEEKVEEARQEGLSNPLILLSM